MKIEHLAIWVEDLETMKNFYINYFGGKAGEIYHNPLKNFRSYFLEFDTGCRLELMYKSEISHRPLPPPKEHQGIAHFAISVGSKEAVYNLTQTLRAAGYCIIGEPRTTGDGYYESVVLDPEHNRIEITI